MNPKQNIRAILFDFVGVLMKMVDTSPDPIADEINRVIGSVTNDDVFKKEVQGKFKLTDAQFDGFLEKIVNRFERFEPLWDKIPSLKNNYKLAIINNGTALTLPRVFTRFPETTTQFDVFISSAKEGVKKPEKEIFLRTCKKLNVQPHECLFMDDDKRNTDAASALGMQTIWWETHEKGFEEFSKIV